MADAGDATPAPELANKIANLSSELDRITKENIQASKSKDIKREAIQQLTTRFADACELLASQLNDPVDRNAFIAKDNENEKFWLCVREVIGLWIRNVEDLVRRMRKDQKKDFENFAKKKLLPFSFAIIAPAVPMGDTFDPFWRVQSVITSHMQDAQMMISLFNLQSELPRSSGIGQSCFNFMAKDLEWKAMVVQSRVHQARQELKQPQGWSRTQELIAETCMDTASRARKAPKAMTQPSSLEPYHDFSDILT